MILKPNHIKGFKFAYIMNIGSYKKLSGGADYIESVLHRNNVEFKNFVTILIDDPKTIEETQLRCELGVILGKNNNNISTKFLDIKIKYVDDFWGLSFHYKDKIENIDKYYHNTIEKILDSPYNIISCPIEFYKKSPLISERDGLCDIMITFPIYYTKEGKV